jgi:hypothetical protein
MMPELLAVVFDPRTPPVGAAMILMIRVCAAPLGQHRVPRTVGSDRLRCHRAADRDAVQDDERNAASDAVTAAVGALTEFTHTRPPRLAGGRPA